VGWRKSSTVRFPGRYTEMLDHPVSDKNMKNTARLHENSETRVLEFIMSFIKEDKPH